MADNVEVLFNNGDQMNLRGRDHVKDGIEKFWQSFDTLRHEEINIYGTDQNFAHEALNHFTTWNGKRVTVRALACIDRDERGDILSLRIYSDQSELWTTR